MNQKKKKAPYIPDVDVPEPSVPNRAHTEMSLGDFAAAPHKAGKDATLGNFDGENKVTK